MLAQSGVKYVCCVPRASTTSCFQRSRSHRPTESRDRRDDHRRLSSAHRTAPDSKGVRVIGTTIPPFEGATFSGAGLERHLHTPESERARRGGQRLDTTQRAHSMRVADFDEVLRDPVRPTRLLPAFAVEDHLHVNDAGNVAQANAISLAVFGR